MDISTNREIEKGEMEIGRQGDRDRQTDRDRDRQTDRQTESVIQ